MSLAYRMLDAMDVFLGEARATARERRLARLRDQLQRDLQHAFRFQGADFQQRLTDIEALWPATPQQLAFPGWEQQWDETAIATAPRFVNPIVDTIKASMMIGAEALGRDLVVQAAFSLENPLALRYIREHGGEMVTNVAQTTKDYIRTLIGHGIDEGWSYDRMARALTDRFAEFAVGKPQKHIDSRAHLIAVTETGNAYEEGSAIVTKSLADLGLVMEKSWLTVGDDRVSDGCTDNEAAGWILNDEPFPSGHMHPLRFPGCRCAALYRRRPGVNR